jgi:uncharacterized membrane protein
MFYFPLGCLAGILFLFAIALLLVLIFFNLVAFSFEKLGLSSGIAILVLLLTLVGSMINIPVTRKRMEYTQEVVTFGFLRIPQQRVSGLAINIGGAIVPVCLSAYLLTVVPSFWQVAVATALMAVICKLLARPIPGAGIGIPMFIPPIAASIFALILARDFAAPCAYISGTLGTLIGADILNLRKINRMGGVASIGGAGVFDGIFLVGIVSVLLTALF